MLNAKQQHGLRHNKTAKILFNTKETPEAKVEKGTHLTRKTTKKLQKKTLSLQRNSHSFPIVVKINNYTSQGAGAGDGIFAY